jgi:hypothetical protein
MVDRASSSIFVLLAVSVAGCTTASRNSLTSVEAVAPGAQCTAGGIEVLTGIDANDNSRLEASEVLSTSYVCNGAAASSQNPAALVSVVPEPPGHNCPDGGSAIEAGSDTNGNGVLDPGEVTTTSYVCDGESGVLVRVAPEPAGSNCLRGGSAILSGFDTNHDGILEGSEVTNTSYVCDPVPTVLVGDVTINSAADLTQLTGVPRIEGNLIIQAPDVTLLYLPDLVEIAGGLNISAQYLSLTTVHLPKLVTIGGALYIELGGKGDLLTELTLPALTSASSLDINDSYLTTLDLDALTSVPGTFFLAANGLTSMPKLPALTRTGAATIESSGFTTFAWPPSWREVDGDLTIEYLSQLPTLAVGPVDVHGNASINNIQTMTALSVDGNIDGTLTVASNAALTSLSPAHVGSLVVQQNTALQNLILPIGVGETLATLQVLQNPALTTIEDLGDVSAIGLLDVEFDVALTTLSLPRLAVANQITVIAGNLPQCWETKLDAQLTGFVQQLWGISSTPGTCN